MEQLAAIGTLAGLGLTAGFRLYATVLAIGLGIRYRLLHPHPGLENLAVLASPYVLVPAGLAYSMEFLADKIPWVDSLWDSFHTFIRPVGAALLGAAAAGELDSAAALGLGLLSGGMALTGHSAKAGTRLLVNHSPEPFSNIALSFLEDVLAIGGAWLAVEHPLVALGIAAAFVALFAWLAPKLFRLLHGLLAALRALLTRPVAALPAGFEARLGGPSGTCVRAIARHGAGGLRNVLGYLCFTPQGPVFVGRKWRLRDLRMEPAGIEAAEFRRGFLLDRITFRTAGGRIEFDLLKTRTELEGDLNAYRRQTLRT